MPDPSGFSKKILIQLKAINRPKLIFGIVVIIIILFLGLITQDTSSQGQESLTVIIFDVVLKLGIVILLIYLSAYLFQKWGKWGRTQKEEITKIELIDTLSLSPRRSIYLIKIDNNSFLVGATDQAINLIAEIKQGNNKTNADAQQELSNITTTPDFNIQSTSSPHNHIKNS